MASVCSAQYSLKIINELYVLYYVYCAGLVTNTCMSGKLVDTGYARALHQVYNYVLLCNFIHFCRVLFVLYYLLSR